MKNIKIDCDAQLADALSTQEKMPWEAPEVTAFKPVSDTHGPSYRIGDGISNLS